MASEGRYLEAEQIRVKIVELSAEMKGNHKRDLNTQHFYESKTLEENYNKELMEINSTWEKRIEEFEQNAKGLEQSLNGKHEKEMEESIINLDNKISKIVKFSREYLQLKQSEQLLVKQEK